MQTLKNLQTYFYPRTEVIRAVSDPLAPFSTILAILKLLGLCISRQSSWKYMILAICARVLLIDALAALQIIFLFNATTIVEITAVGSILVSFISAFYEMLVLYYNIHAVESLIEEIRDCVADFGLNENFIKRVSVISKVLKGSMGLAIYSLSTSFISCVAFHKSPFVMWMPLDIGNEFNFWLIFFYQSIGCWYISPVNVTLQLLPSYFIVYIYGLEEQLCERLEKIKKHRVLNPDGTINQKKRVDNRKELIKCIKFHVRIHQINKKVSDMFSIVFLVRGILTCILICSTTFSLFAISDTAIITQFTAYTCYIFVQLFIPCYFGNRIIEMSSRILSSIGHSEWMLEDKEYRQLVKIMLEFAKKPMKITSFGLFDMDLENYAWVCRSAYSLFAVCMRLNGN
jgi:hypothetical protein